MFCVPTNMRYTRKMPEQAEENHAEKRLSLLAHQAVHAEDSVARTRAYQDGLRSFTLDELYMIGERAPDLCVRYAAQMQAYLKQTGYNPQSLAGQLEQRLEVPRAEDVNRTLIKPRQPAESLDEAAGDDEDHEYLEAI